MPSISNTSRKRDLFVLLVANPQIIFRIYAVFTWLSSILFFKLYLLNFFVQLPL